MSDQHNNEFKPSAFEPTPEELEATLNNYRNYNSELEDTIVELQQELEKRRQYIEKLLTLMNEIYPKAPTDVKEKIKELLTM